MMSQRAKEFAERFRAFNQEVVEFVENCSDDNWRKVCAGEEWPVGVVARHIGAGHYQVLDFAKMILSGEKLPELTMETINDMNARHAQEHADCSRDEVLGLLRENGSAIVAFISGLTDEALDRTGHLALIGGDVSVQQFIENIIIQSAGQHLASMKTAIES